VVTITAAAAIAAAGCGSSQQHSDTAAVRDTAAVSSPVDSAAGAASTSATSVPNATSPTTVAAGAKGTTTSPASSKRPAADTAKRGTGEPDVRAPLPTSPAPGVRIPPGTGTPAFIVFRDSLTTADLDWVRSEGMEIVSSDKGARSVSVMVPDGYHGHPRSNPRVLRFTIAMR
jgi:hypothetical protein